MRTVMIGLWFVVSVAAVVSADETLPAEEATEVAEPQAAESSPSAEAAADAEIERIEAGVSSAKDVKEFTPTKPLSADKAIALPSDI